MRWSWDAESMNATPTKRKGLKAADAASVSEVWDVVASRECQRSTGVMLNMKNVLSKICSQKGFAKCSDSTEMTLTVTRQTIKEADSSEQRPRLDFVHIHIHQSRVYVANNLNFRPTRCPNRSSIYPSVIGGGRS